LNFWSSKKLGSGSGSGLTKMPDPDSKHWNLVLLIFFDIMFAVHSENS
jgi:hypothetical protein